MALWQDLKDKFAGRPTDAEVRRMEPKGEDEARYVQQERDALKYRSRHNDTIARNADLGLDLAALRHEMNEAAVSPVRIMRDKMLEAPPVNDQARIQRHLDHAAMFRQSASDYSTDGKAWGLKSARNELAQAHSIIQRTNTMARQHTKSEIKEVRQERAAEFWQQRIQVGQSQQQAAQQQPQKQAAREMDRPRQIQQ